MSSTEDGAAGGAVGAVAAVLVLLGVVVFVYRRRQQVKTPASQPTLTSTVSGADKVAAPANRKMSEVRVSWTPRARPTPPPEAHPDLTREHTAGGSRKDFI